MERRHMDDMECSSYTPEGTVAFLCAISRTGNYYPVEKQKHEVEQSADFTGKGVSLWTVQTVMVDYGTAAHG